MSKKTYVFFGGIKEEMPLIPPIAIQTDFGRARALAWYGMLQSSSVGGFSSDGGSFGSPIYLGRRRMLFNNDEAQIGEGSRESRFNALRAEGKKLGEINAILEAEGFSEVWGEGVLPAPTQSHQIVRENKGAKKMIVELP